MFQYCLSTAIKDKVTSIAFPCIGAGGLKYDQMTVFNCLLDVINILSKTATYSLKVIYLHNEWNNNILLLLITFSNYLALISDMNNFSPFIEKKSHTNINTLTHVLHSCKYKYVLAYLYTITYISIHTYNKQKWYTYIFTGGSDFLNHVYPYAN